MKIKDFFTVLWIGCLMVVCGSVFSSLDNIENYRNLKNYKQLRNNRKILNKKQRKQFVNEIITTGLLFILNFVVISTITYFIHIFIIK
jgi:hypothetical protein